MVIAFAHTSQHARSLFQEWNRLAYGDGGGNATVAEMSPGLLKGLGDAQRSYKPNHIGALGPSVTRLRIAGGFQLCVARNVDAQEMASSIHPGRADRRRAAAQPPCQKLQFATA